MSLGAASWANKLAVRTICLIYTGRQACQEGFERQVKKNLLRRQEYNTVIVLKCTFLGTYIFNYSLCHNKIVGSPAGLLREVLGSPADVLARIWRPGDR